MTLVVLAALCQQAPTLDAEAGFQGTVFPDCWTRISVTLAYEGDSLDAEIRVTIRSYTSDPVTYRRPTKLVRKVRLRTGFDVYLTEYDYQADVEILEKEKVLRKLTLALSQNREEHRRLLVVGTPPSILLDAMAKKPPVTEMCQIWKA